MKHLTLILIIALIGCTNASNKKCEISTKDSISRPIADKNFYDFLANFYYDKDFQLKRTTIANWEYQDFHSKYGYQTFMYNKFEIPDEEFQKDKTNKRFLEIVDIQKWTKTVYSFSKNGNIWQLTNKEETEFKTDSVIDFETFLYHFSTDTTFAKRHISFPLKYIGLNDNYEDTTTYITADKEIEYNFFRNNEFIFYFTTDFNQSNKINLFYRGIDNGIHFNYYFEKRDDKWVLVEETDYST